MKTFDVTTKERPILFKPEMVKAILSGEKTQTRRIIKPQPEQLNSFTPQPLSDFTDMLADKSSRGLEFIHGKGAGKGLAFPDWYAHEGDTLWVRETWAKLVERYKDGSLLYLPRGFKYVYKADGVHMDSWKPSIHMPKEACRLRLLVTDVRVERLYDISEEDAKAEGVKSTAVLTEEGDDYTGLYACEHFMELWQRINGVESYESNPWVWALTFRQIPNA
jgi:hypothetical protein